MKNILVVKVVLVILLSYNVAQSQQSNNSFLNPPQLIEDPGLYYKYSPDSREFTGISSMAVSKNGRMWAVWYAGVTPNEDNNNYVVVATSEDNGENWEEILAIDPDGGGPVRAYDPEVWIDPNGEVWVFWAQAIGHNGSVAGVWATRTKDLMNKFPNWSKPQRLTDGVMMCKPTVLSSGEWILPASTWRQTDKSAKVIVSTDNGSTWSERGACHVPKEDRSFDEHMIVERLDGSLWMLARTNYGIGQSFSKDRGKTWSELEPSNIKHPSARFFIRRLASGNLLLVKHGPISTRTGRSHLMAFISKDDGGSWSKGMLIDERPSVSYPDGQQTSDGTIYITYDYDRRGEQKVYMTSFTETDVLSDDFDESVYKVFKNRKMISDAGR